MRLVALATLLISSTQHAAAQQGPDASRQPLNLNFELSNRDYLPGWLTVPSGATIALDSVQPASGKWSLRVERPQNAEGYSAASQAISRDAVAGRRIRLSGHIRTAGVTGGYAGLWLRVDGEGERIDNMADRGPTGTTPWTRYELEMAIPPCADGVAFGVLFPGAGTAWFDSLNIQILDAPSPTPFRVCGEPEAPEWISWTRQNAVALRSLSSDDFSDLMFLKPLLEGKRIVQLGESSHGIAEFNRLKARLVKFLHQELGYDVVAFESSLHECFQADRAAPRLTPEQLMRHCIFGIWYAEETLPLFEYIKETQASARPLTLAGFDTQAGIGELVVSRAAMFRKLFDPVDTTFAQRVQQMDWKFNWASIPENADSFVAGYGAVVTFIDRNFPALVAASGNDTALVAVARQTAWSMIRFVNQRRAKNGLDGGILARDSGMAANLDFLLDRLYPGKKIITWGHNFHFRHQNDSIGPGPVRTMGGWVSQQRRDELYTVGLYMHHGRATYNHREMYDIETPWPGTCESILGSATGDYLFLDMSRAPRSAGSEWLYKPIICREGGFINQRMVPRNQYDALLLIRETRPPSYLPR